VFTLNGSVNHTSPSLVRGSTLSQLYCTITWYYKEALERFCSRQLMVDS